MIPGTLSGILGILFVVLIMYFIMRKGGGCCGHSHGEHHKPEGHSSGESNAGKSKDPVCGMTVAEENAAGTSEYEGKTYYFCAAGCRESFEKEPEKYVKAEGEEGQKHGCCG
jgi:YHS domain-containing protein